MPDSWRCITRYTVWCWIATYYCMVPFPYADHLLRLKVPLSHESDNCMDSSLFSYFLDQELISYCFLFLLLLGVISSKQPDALPIQTVSRWNLAGIIHTCWVGFLIWCHTFTQNSAVTWNIWNIAEKLNMLKMIFCWMDCLGSGTRSSLWQTGTTGLVVTPWTRTRTRSSQLSISSIWPTAVRANG